LATDAALGPPGLLADGNGRKALLTAREALVVEFRELLSMGDHIGHRLKALKFMMLYYLFISGIKIFNYPYLNYFDFLIKIKHLKN
jgi:hypothetical protein